MLCHMSRTERTNPIVWLCHGRKKPKATAELGAQAAWAAAPPNMVLLSPGLPLGQQPGGGGVAEEAHAGGRRHQVSHLGEHQVLEAGLCGQAHPQVSDCGSWDGKGDAVPGLGMGVVGTRRFLLWPLGQLRSPLHLAAWSKPTPRWQWTASCRWLSTSPAHRRPSSPGSCRRRTMTARPEPAATACGAIAVGQEGHGDTLLLRGQTSPPHPVPQPSNWDSYSCA